MEAFVLPRTLEKVIPVLDTSTEVQGSSFEAAEGVGQNRFHSFYSTCISLASWNEAFLDIG